MSNAASILQAQHPMLSKGRASLVSAFPGKQVLVKIIQKNCPNDAMIWPQDM